MLRHDTYLANSTVVQDRMRATYGIEASVLFPPSVVSVDGDQDPVGPFEPGFHLVVSRLLPYKNVDQVVAAYADEPRRRLVVVGSGPEKQGIRAAASDNVLFLEAITDGELAWLYRRSNALIAISYEDYGLTPLEAAAFGKPSIVLRWGGYVETMVENLTAVFIEAPRAEHVRQALEQLDAREWDPERIVEHSVRFHEDVFVENLRELVKSQLEKQRR